MKRLQILVRAKHLIIGWIVAVQFSLLCGLAWQGLGWWGVLALCLIAISVSFVSLLTLCA